MEQTSQASWLLIQMVCVRAALYLSIETFLLVSNQLIHPLPNSCDFELVQWGGGQQIYFPDDTWRVRGTDIPQLARQVLDDSCENICCRG